MARIGSPSNQRIARTQLGANENLFLTIFRDRSGLELILRNKYKMRTGPQGPPSRYVGKLEGSARVREGSRLTTTLVTLVSLLYSAMQTCNTHLSIAALPAFLRCCLLVTFVCFSLHFCATYHFPIKKLLLIFKGLPENLPYGSKSKTEISASTYISSRLEMVLVVQAVFHGGKLPVIAHPEFTIAHGARTNLVFYSGKNFLFVGYFREWDDVGLSWGPFS